MSELKLIVGLGNPGREYEGTRHNIGFEVLDLWAQKNSAEFELQKKWEGEVAKTAGLTALKPMTFMNLSCLLYTSPSPRDQRGSRMPSSA